MEKCFNESVRYYRRMVAPDCVCSREQKVLSIDKKMTASGMYVEIGNKFSCTVSDRFTI